MVGQRAERGLLPGRRGAWLPLGPGAAASSVAAQERDTTSLLRLYRRLLALRRADYALALGAWEGLRAADGVLAYVRGGRFLIALNLTGDERALALGGHAGTVAVSARIGRDGARAAGELRLAGDDALIVRLDGGAG